jgi:Methyltransferase domain
MHGSMRRRQETRPVGHAARPTRLPPTLPRPLAGPLTHRTTDDTRSSEAAPISRPLSGGARVSYETGRDIIIVMVEAALRTRIAPPSTMRAQVAAVDPFEPYVETCRARVPGADVRVGAGERLPFAANRFDVVLVQLVVQLMQDRDTGVREMTRVGRPREPSRRASGDARSMPLLRSFWDAALEAAPERTGETDDDRRVGYERPEELGTLFQACGLEHVATGELLVGADYENFDELWRPFTAGVGHSGSCCTSLDMARQADLRTDVHRRLGSPEGAFRLTARVRWARRSIG